MKKQLLVILALFVSVICFTSANPSNVSTRSIADMTLLNPPGYDINGQDIDECSVYAPCPEGYTCKNLPGSFVCEASPGYEGETGGGTTRPDIGNNHYSVTAECVGTAGECKAKCKKCCSIYTAFQSGTAINITGTCQCGNRSFNSFMLGI